MLVLMAIVTTATTSPIVWWVWLRHPETKFDGGNHDLTSYLSNVLEHPGTSAWQQGNVDSDDMVSPSIIQTRREGSIKRETADPSTSESAQEAQFKMSISIV